MMDNNTQQIVYEGKSDIEAFCFHQQSKQIYFTIQNTIHIYSVVNNRIVDEYPVPISIKCSVSNDGQLLILLSPFPENVLRLYRFVSLEHELIEVTNVQLPTPKYINESLERLYNRNQDLSSSLYQNLQTPYEKVEFIPGSNTHIIIITKFTIHVCKIQINTGYTYLNIQQILSSNDPRNKHMLFNLYLVNNLIDLVEYQTKCNESTKQQRQQDSLEFYENVQIILNQFTEKQLQNPMQQLDQRAAERHKMQYLINKQVQNAFQQLNKQVISPKYNRGASDFQYTGFRYNMERLLDDKRFFESVFEFCDFTGQYEVFIQEDITFVFVVDKNLGILVFCLQNNQSSEKFNEFSHIKAMFLDIDYGNFQQDHYKGELNAEQLGLELIGPMGVQGTSERLNYTGDCRLMAVAIGSELIDAVLPLSLGFQDSSVKRYEIFATEKPTYDQHHTIQPSNVMYYYALGPIVSMLAINLEQSSTIYGILNSNKVIFCQFSDFLAYIPAIYTEETDQFSIKKPKIITDYISYSLERLRHVSALVTAAYEQQIAEHSDAEKKYWNTTLKQLVGAPQYLSSYHIELLQTPTDQPMAADWQMFVTDDGYEVIIKCLIDGRIILSSKNGIKFITTRCPINALDQSWLVPDGILAAISIRQQKLLITAHVSGYMRIFAFQGDGTLKLINRLKLSQMPLTHLCISQDLKDICAVDAQHMVFFVNNVSENNVVTGYFNIKEVPNLTQLNKQNMYKLTLSYNEYMNQMLNVLIYKDNDTFYKKIDLPSNMDPQKQTYNMSIINFQQQKQNKEQAKHYKEIAQKILNSQDLGNNIEAVKPLPVTYQNKYLKSMFQYVVQVRASGPYFYFVLATGEILKITVPSPQRHTMAMDNVNAMQNESLIEKLNQMTDYELKQIETKFLQIQQENHINVFDEMEYSIIKTGLAISELAIDPMIISAPYNISDLLYIGTFDGKVFVYGDKPVLKQPGMNSKLDFPLLSFPVMQLDTPIQQISINDNILSVSDSLKTIVTPCILPTQEAMKKQSQACLKNDELQVTISGAELSLQETLDLKSTSTKFFIYAGIPGSKIPKIISANEILILSRNGISVRSQLNEVIAKAAADSISAYNSASQQFITQLMNQQALTDVAAQNKNLLKAAYDMRQVLRDFKLQQSDLQTLQQQLLSLQPFADGPLKENQLIAFSVNQHFCKQATQQALDELCGVEIEKDCSLQEFDLREQEKHVRLMNQRVKSRILLTPLPGRLECDFLNAARLFQLVASSYLRYKQNQQLIEESIKITELSKDIEKQNFTAINEKGLLVLPKKASMTFLTNLREQYKDHLDYIQSLKKEAVTEAELVNERPQTVEKIIAASSIITEQEARVNNPLANIARSSLLQKASQYEKQFKAELLAVKTFQNNIYQQRVQACEEGAVGEAVCGINDKKMYVASISVPQDSAVYKRKAKKMAMLRAAQLVSERMAPHLPPALVKNADGKFVAPTEQQLQQQQFEIIQEFKMVSIPDYKPITNVTDISDIYEIPESRIVPEDPFRITKPEEFSSETLLRALELGSTPQLRAMHVPYQREYVLSNADAESEEEKQLSCDQLLSLINNVPAVKYFYKVQTPSLRRACFLEGETTFQVRAVQQMYTLKAITLLLIKDINGRIAKVKEDKFKTIQTITDKVNQIIDIGKELTYHAREEIMMQMIADYRKQLFDEYQGNGVALEECAERAARNAPQIINSREKEVDELAFKKLDETGVLDLNSIMGYSGLKQVNKVESLAETLKVPSVGQYGFTTVQNILRKLAGQSALEKYAQATQLFQNEIRASGDVSQVVKEALAALTDQGLFKLNDLDEQIKDLNAELSQSNIQVSAEVLETAESYKRAIYEMMRGSLESGSRDSIRDVIIPACYGLPQGKLSKDQQAQIDKYEKFLETTVENRFKDTKLLTTQSQTLKEQIAQICQQFDGQTLKQLRDRVFNGLVKINALELNQTIIISRKLAYQKQKELLQQKQKYSVQFSLLKEQVDANIKYLNDEVIQKYQISINAINDALTYFNATAEKYILLPDQQLREFLKKPVRSAQLIQQIRQFLNTDNRNKVKQALLQQPGNPEQAKVVEEFYGQYQNYLLEDGMGAFKQCQANYEKYIQNFFDTLSPVGTLAVNSYSALLNDPVFPDAVTCRNQSLKNLLGAFQIVYQTPYLAIFSKIIPIESDIKCTHQQQLRVYDALRSFKSIASIVQFQQKERLAQAQELVVQLEALRAAMEDCETFDTTKDLAGIKKHFCDQYVLTLFREGQIEYQRNFEAINDMRLISYKVDTDGNVLQTTKPNNPNVHEDENIIMRDDSQFLVVDRSYLEKQINDNLISKYNQLNDKLTELSKVHARIRNLQSECQITHQRTENTINETKDFQMIRVSKDMLEIIRHNTSNENRKQQELKILQNKILHSKKSQDTMLSDRQAQLERIPLEMQRLQNQNNQLLQQIEEAEAKNQQREQAIPDFVDEAEEANYEEDAALFMNLEQKYARLRALKNPAGKKTTKSISGEDGEETDKKFRRIAALRKMRELRTAQEEEMKFLLTELDRLRKKTYIQFE